MDEIGRKKEQIEEIKAEALNCRKCALFKTRNNPVVGAGSLEARIMFVGEAPGYWEDQKAIPFCGAAGKILDWLLESIGLKREEIYITNIVKCRPTTPDFKNRAPRPEEIKACSPYLIRQIGIIKPRIICSLGNYSTAFIFEKYGLKERIEGISRIHGKLFESKNLFASIKIIPLYHPAVATYNPNMKQVLLEDFKILKNLS
jgi:DNA polymerase